MWFSPFVSIMKAKNKKDALKKIKSSWSEYNVNEVLQYLENY